MGESGGQIFGVAVWKERWQRGGLAKGVVGESLYRSMVAGLVSALFCEPREGCWLAGSVFLLSFSFNEVNWDKRLTLRL